MKLKKYLKDNDISINAFSKKTSLARPTIVRAMEGKEIYLSCACRIEKATKGEVTLKDLMPTKLKSKVVSQDESCRKSFNPLVIFP